MAFQVGLVCYDTQLEAAQAQASSFGGALVGQAGNAHSVAVATVTPDAITYVLTPVSGGAAITHVAPFSPQPCNMLQAADGLAIGWMIAAAWVAAYGVLFIKHALSGETGSGYGNT